MKQLTEIFADNLKYLRKKAGYTQRELADIIGYSEKAISKWESATAIPPAETLYSIAQVFRTTMDSMLERAEEPLYYAGIDGGGTKTLFALADATGKVLSTVTLGPCNPMTVGFEAMLKIIGEGLEKLCAGISPRRVSVFAGIAGVVPDVNADILHKYLLSLGYGVVKIGNDTENVVAAALGDSDGIAVIMGTGSNMFTKRGEVLRQYGGYGYLFDQGGNGYSIARDAMSAVLADENNYGPHTMLTEIFKKENGCNLSSMMPDLYSRGNRYIASFARLVDIAYDSGDPVAADIFDRNMKHTATLINYAIVDFEGETVNAYFVGGLTKRSDVFFPLIEKHLAGRKKVNLIVYEHEPVLGALRLSGAPIDTSVGNGIVRGEKT
ncbi:MAG: XRE family transcriptional regulator [Clostridia bacterium]|nr:XRE family transcriptional regulator [Clostridia bacterium]